MKHSWEIDVNVLIIFFVRDDVLQKTFEAVKKARPRRLLLWQDGPRDSRPDDIKAIERCRKVVEKIDWDCEVYTKYNEKNFGCDPSTFYSHKWAFSIVDKCIILEDDMVANKSFFYYCYELLNRYENDERINHICGVNFIKEVNCPSDYIFAYSGTGAWATWKRVADGWDENYTFLDKQYYLNNLKTKEKKKLMKVVIKTAEDRKKRGKAYWETILGFNCMLNNRLVIIPKKNLVSNIGLTPEATHGTSPKLMSKKQLGMFNMKAEEVLFPMKHPEYIVPDRDYYKKWCKLLNIGHSFNKFVGKCGYVLRCVFKGEIKRVFKALARKVKR